SRDEAKQHELRLRWGRLGAATDDAIWRDSSRRVQFRVGDIRDPEAIGAAAEGADTIIHAAALKQVPTCEYFPEEAVRTNVLGAENVVRAARRARVATVIGVSTDKAVKPVNVMGMSKSLQERVLARANLDLPGCRFALVRYGNVLASRGSVVPLFLEQAARGEPLTVTDPAMTRFLLAIEDAVDAVIRAVAHARRGETLVPMLPSACITDLARAIGGEAAEIRVTGTRPGEKLHEILISEEERHRTRRRGQDLFVGPILPELREDAADGDPPPFNSEYSSADGTVDAAEARRILDAAGLLRAG
ncbi:MAG TPA: polysaccharide biosynthesis protein, partial [Acetobacteraceae bacterium]|nr:polysaccharide biosynthesis protein [Acetobacteraceae bacterium]